MNRFVITVSTGDRPLVLNRERRLHWSVRSTAVDDWHEATHTQLMLDRVRERWVRAGFRFYPQYPKGPLPDTVAVFPSTKAIVDALVAHGLIPDDNPHHNAWEVHYAPVLNPDIDAPQISVTAYRLEPVDGHEACDCRLRYERALVKSGR